MQPTWTKNEEEADQDSNVDKMQMQWTFGALREVPLTPTVIIDSH